jgi:hypothetical protein
MTHFTPVNVTHYNPGRYVFKSCKKLLLQITKSTNEIYHQIGYFIGYSFIYTNLFALQKSIVER